MEIFTQEGGVILSRWGHYLAGVTWVGLLYYFNFVQAPSFAHLEAGARAEVLEKLVPRALWWFRYAAVLTVLTGISILAFQENLGADYFKTAPGISISTGILLALVMFANVWMVIWPKQRSVIAASRTAGGAPADPATARAARMALLVSRTNTVLSIPMLWFMGVTSHFAGSFELTPEGGERALYWLITLALVAALELNALGVIGGTGQGPTKTYLETHKHAVLAGLALWAVFVVVWEAIF
ncbi:MAG: urate hydroxylase PuuD [Actinomycetota bacterium]|nr:urate hydroxylase PuuD [Actinomycetota bacterium]